VQYISHQEQATPTERLVHSETSQMTNSHNSANPATGVLVHLSLQCVGFLPLGQKSLLTAASHSDMLALPSWKR
jgi:hypothetical protein